MPVAFIPSPTHNVWHVFGVPVRAYALCILLGVAVAIWMGERRFVARGGRTGAVGDVAVWAVPFGLIGARAYHVMTDPELYFGAGKHPVDALYVWKGGLGIWGAVALGALGGWIACRIYKIRFTVLADAIAPGLVVAQAIGRWGNYFNQELFGKPTTKPWGLKIDAEHRPPGYQSFSTFQPTFLYECIWDLGVAGVVIWADRRFKLGYGRVFALYVMLYTLGRAWIEYLRIDTVNHVLGLRLNVWTSIIVFCLAAAYFVIVGRRHPGREPTAMLDRYGQDDADTDGVEVGDAATEDESTAAGDESESSDRSVVPDKVDPNSGSDSDADLERRSTNTD